MYFFAEIVEAILGSTRRNVERNSFTENENVLLSSRKLNMRFILMFNSQLT